MEKSRRGFLAFLGIAPIAGVVAAKTVSELALESVLEGVDNYGMKFAINAQNEINIRRSAAEKLMNFRREIVREYARENLFSPYVKT